MSNFNAPTPFSAPVPDMWQIGNALPQILRDRQTEIDTNAAKLEEQKTLTEQRKLEVQKSQTEAAQNQIKMVGSYLIANPSAASDPNYQKVVTDSYAKIGMPAPLNQDGSIDINAFKEPWSGLDQRTTQMILQLPTEQRKSILDRYSGVPKEAYNATAYVTAKDQAKMESLRLIGIKDERWNKIQEQRTAIRQQRADAQDRFDTSRMAQIDANIAKTREDTQRIIAETAAIPNRLAMAAARLDLLKDKVTQGGTGLQAQRMINQEAGSMITQYTQAQNAYTRLSAQLETMMINGVDEEDPGFIALKGQAEELKSSVDSLKPNYEQAMNLRNGQASALQSGASVSSVSGNPSTATPVKEANGKIVTGSDGNKYQQQSNGKWKRIS